MSLAKKPESADDEGRASVIDFSLPVPLRFFSVVLGVVLMGFAAQQLVSNEFNPAVLVLVVFGAGLVLLGLVRFGRVGRVVVEAAGTKVSLEPERPKEEDESSSAVAAPKQPDEHEVETGVVEEVVESDLKDGNGEDPFWDAIRAFIDKDYSKFNSKMDEAIAVAEDEASKVALDAMRLGRLYNIGQSDRLQELQELRTKFPASPYPILRVGDCYFTAGNYDEAARLFAEAYKIGGLAEKERVMVLSRQTEALRKGKRFEDAEDRLVDGLAGTKTPSETAEIEKLLAELYKHWGKVADRQLHLERALVATPGDCQARFDLAYSYREDDQDPLAFYHYDILRIQRDGSSELNNLAGILENMEMPITAVKYYRTAGRDNTISLGNVARMAGRQGFVTEARAVLKEALEREEVNANVHTVLADISAWEKEESERLERIREGADAEHSLFFKRTELERGGTKPAGSQAILDTWETDVGELAFTEEGGKQITRFKDGVWDWELKGAIKGYAYEFEWNCDTPRENHSGDGYFLLTGSDEFEGIIRHTPKKGEVKVVRGKRKTARPVDRQELGRLLKELSQRPDK